MVPKMALIRGDGTDVGPNMLSDAVKAKASTFKAKAWTFEAEAKAFKHTTRTQINKIRYVW